MKRKMEQDRIPGWKGITAAQWAAILAYALATPPVTVRAAQWQPDTARGERFPECLDFLLKDIVKRNKASLTRLLAAQPLPAVAPIAAPGVASVAVGNDRKLPHPSAVNVPRICYHCSCRSRRPAHRLSLDRSTVRCPPKQPPPCPAGLDPMANSWTCLLDGDD